MKKNKISTLQVSRLVIQIIFFIFLPSLYIDTFAGIRQIYTAIIKQNIAFTQLIPQMIEVIAIIPITIIMGRFFCGWMCAYGAFGDFIYMISRKVFKIKFRISEETDSVLKYLKYVLLVFLVIVVWNLNITAFSTFSSWDVFGMVAIVGKAPDFSYAASNLTIGFILFLIIAIGSMFIERFFCRYLCPLGAVFAITSKLRIAKIRKVKTKCGNCRICTSNCAMGIPLYKNDVVKSGECINCLKCISPCPRKNVTLAVSGEDVRPLVAGIATASMMTGLYYGGNLVVNAAGLNNIQIQTQGSQSSAALYKDGTYEGSGTGFRGRTTTVSVVVKNGVISQINTLSYGDDEQFYSRASNTVIPEIISSQSSNVDAVSGATFSSNGIMEAVANALSNAKISTDSSSSSSKTQQDTNTTASNTQENTKEATDNTQQATKSESNSTVSSDNGTASNTAANAGDSTSTKSSTETGSNATSSTETTKKYKDGTYEGSGTGFRGGTTKISVTVKGGKITDITTVSYEDDRPFYNRAFNTVPQEIVSSQSTNVDAVSGATFSSRGIMRAVADALSKAE